MKGSFDQAQEVKKTVSGGVRRISDANFKKANELIDKYNSELSDFQSVMGPTYQSGFTPLQPVTASDVADGKGDPVQPQFDTKIVGKWTGTKGQLRYSYEFRSDGTFSVGVKSPVFYQLKKGTWKTSGNDITANYVNSGAPGTGGASQARAIQAGWSSGSLVFDDVTLAKE